MSGQLDHVQPQPAQGMASANAEANRAVAEIQSAMTIAKRFPRNEIQAIENIKNTFGRRSLAEVSQYQYAKGGTSVSGPSIRSAEAIAQRWGNIQFGFREISRGINDKGIGYSEIEAYAWDIESNTKRPAIFIVPHWRDSKKGGYEIKDEREIYELTANMAQRRVRACIMAVIPGDIFDEAMIVAEQTLKANADLSPEGLKKLADTFKNEFGIPKSDIEARIQRKLESIQAGQVVQLKRIYRSLVDGMSEPSDWFGDKPSAATEKAESAPEQDMFETNFEGWSEKIKAGSKTAKQMIAFLSKKMELTEDQKARLNNVKVEK
jgi:hypothetical protein